MKRLLLTLVSLLFFAGVVFPFGRAAISKPQEAPQWHPVSINFVPFYVQPTIAITPESIYFQREVTFSEERDFLHFKDLLNRRVEGLRKGAYKFEPLGTRLRYESGKDVLYIDDNGVVKTPKEEYLLTPRAFLKMSRFLDRLLDEKYNPGFKKRG